MAPRKRSSTAHLPDASPEDTTTKAKVLSQFTANVLIGVFLSIILSKEFPIANMLFEALKSNIVVTITITATLALVSSWLYISNSKRVY